MTKILIDRSTVEQALEALEGVVEYDYHGNPLTETDAACNDAINALLSALAEPQEPVAWMRVIDEAMVTHHLGVADPADDYETAKRKMNNLLCMAQDIGTYFAKPAEPVQEPVAWRYKYADGFWRFSNGERVNGCDPVERQPLYTAPPQPAEPVQEPFALPQRKPLTEDAMQKVFRYSFGLCPEPGGFLFRVGRAVERAHGIGDQP